MSEIQHKEKTGKLVDVGRKKLGLEYYYYWQCVDCKSLYPEVKGRISCNGRAIAACPWCGPDSPNAAHVRGDHFHKGN